MDTLLDEMLLECQYVPLSYFLKLMLFFLVSYSKILIPFLCLVKCRLLLLPLHSKITTHEQGNVFKKPEEGFRKVCKNTAYTHEIISKISDL